jgi:hypothetical protein
MKLVVRARSTWWSTVAVATAVVAVVVTTQLVDDGSARARPQRGAVESHQAVRPTERQRKVAIRSGVRVVRAYLDTWRRSGLAAASQAFSVSEQQIEADVGTPRIRSGSVLGAEVWSWEPPDQFTLEVGLELHFDGDPGAWDEGDNGRFVTFTRTGGALRLSFATSP